LSGDREDSLIQPETTWNDVNSLVPWTLNTRHAFNDRNFTKASLRARHSFDNSNSSNDDASDNRADNVRFNCVRFI